MNGSQMTKIESPGNRDLLRHANSTKLIPQVTQGIPFDQFTVYSYIHS